MDEHERRVGERANAAPSSEADLARPTIWHDRDVSPAFPFNVNNIPGFICTMTASGEVEFLNRPVLEYFGKTLLDLQSWPSANEVHPDDLPGVLSAWNRSVTTGAVYEVEHRLRRSDGVYRWFQARGQPERRADGEIGRWYLLLTDIEEHKRSEELALQSQLTIRSIIDSLPGYVHTMKADGTVEFVNQRILEFFQKTTEELSDWAPLVHPEDREAVVSQWYASIAAGEPYDQIHRVRRGDGEWRWFHSRGLPLRNASGQIVRWCNLLVDIHERKKAEEALRVNERNLALIVDSIPGLVARMSAAGEVELANRQLLAYFGKDLEDIRNWTTSGVVHPEDLARAIETAGKSFASGDPYEMEIRVRRFDGIYRWFQARGVPLRDAKGRILSWYALHTDIEDRKTAEEALRSSQRELSVIIETMPGLVWCALPDGELSYVNRRILDYIGVERTELLSGGWAHHLHPEDAPSVVAAWSRSVASGEAFEVQARLRGADGVYRWFHSLSLLGRDTDGNPARWYGVMIDVDDRKRAEDKVEQAYLRLAEAQQLSKTGSFITDLLVDDHNWSEEAFRIFEFDPNVKVTVQMIREMVHPEDLQSFDDVISRGAAGEDVDFVFRIVTPGGALKHIRGMARVMEQVAGRPLFIGALQDVTQSKVEEEQTRRSEAFLAEAQRLTRIGSFSWRIEDNEIRWSDELYRIFEFEPGVRISLDLIGSRVHPEDLPLMADMVEKAHSAASHFAYEHRIVMPDHSIKHMHLTAHSRRDQGGRLEYIGAVQDVTQRHLAEAALAGARAELANASKISSLGVLTASIAHEVSQPLSGIITNASTCMRMLESDSPNLDGVRETARRTLRDGKRASDVISRLRALFAKKEFAREPVNLIEAAREVIALSQTDLQRNRVVLRTEFADSIPLAPGDRIQLQQVISNLLRNASEAMSTVDDRPRLLRIAIQAQSRGQVCLSVEDTGIGLDPAGMDRLFQPFYTTKTQGMGIGLSVSRSIIESHQGRLWATPNEGPGATFSFEIPAIPEGVRE